MPIICYDVYGNAVSVGRSDIAFEPAVYGIFIENERVLLARHPVTGLWHPPGEILTGSLRPEQAIRRYFQRQLRILPELDGLLWLEERYVMDEQGQARGLSVLYYGLKRPFDTKSVAVKTGALLQWVSLAEVDRTHMQFGYDALQAGKLHQQLS
ncbi:MAG: hypothetical protein KC423_18040 [Anaerolineales bacterium]|nr:hypothetical protein [Anaerolineales bacterium]MCB9433074.1 hypothetical protein [Ardenticatenaceae bacterium]